MRKNAEPSLAQFEETLLKLVPELRVAVDVSLKLKKNGQSRVVCDIWEEFLVEFIGYVRRKEEEEGEELLRHLSFAKIMSSIG